MDAVWAGIAKDVVAAGQANCMVRADHEFNGGFYAWAQDQNPADHAAAFARFVTVFPRPYSPAPGLSARSSPLKPPWSVSAPVSPNSRAETSWSRCRSRSATSGAASSSSRCAAATASSPTASTGNDARP